MQMLILLGILALGAWVIGGMLQHAFYDMDDMDNDDDIYN